MKRGGTLIEVMMACVVLAVIAMAGGAYVYQSMGTLAVHRDRSVAVAMANSRMEELRSQSFSILTQQMGSASLTIVTNNSFVRLDYWPVPELVAEGLGTGMETIKITVQITNRPPDYVSLTTIYAP